MALNGDLHADLNQIRAGRRLALLHLLVFGVALIMLYAIRRSVLWGNNGFSSFLFLLEHRPIAFTHHQHTTRIDMPVLYAYGVLLLAIYSLVVGVGFLRRKRWAWKWGRLFPVVAIPLWVMFGWYVGEFLAFSRAGFVGSSNIISNPPATIDDLLVGAMISGFMWVATSLFWMLTLRHTELNTAFTSTSGPSAWRTAVRAAALMIAASILLAVLRMPDGRILIHDTSSYGWTTATRLLLFVGQDVNARTNDGSTPLHFAACSERADTVVTLVQSGADMNARDRYGRTAMVAAAEDSSDSCGILMLLLKHGADPRIKDADGLMVANHLGGKDYPSDLVRLLVQRGIDVNIGIRDEWVNFTLLGYAVEHGKPSDVDFLLSNGAKMYPALAVRANPRMLEHLLDRGFKVDSRDEEGSLPLNYALARDQEGYDDAEQCALILLRHGANINARDKRDQTALHHAAEHPDEKWVSFLLKHGADPNIRDWGNRTPYDVAKGCSWPESRQAMEKSGKLSRPK